MFGTSNHVDDETRCYGNGEENALWWKSNFEHSTIASHLRYILLGEFLSHPLQTERWNHQSLGILENVIRLTLFKIEYVVNKYSWRIVLTPVGGLNFAWSYFNRTFSCIFNWVSENQNQSNHSAQSKGHRPYFEPISTRTNYMRLKQSAGKDRGCGKTYWLAEK